MGDEVMGVWELPVGWKWVPLESVVLKTERRNPAKSPDEPFIYVDISSIASEIGAIANPKALQGREAPSRARKVIRSGDVIFAITRPYLRNIAQVPDQYDDQICSTGFCVLQANRELVDPLWLYHLCRSDVVLDQVLPRMRGASYPAVTDGDVLTSEIPLPPLDEQRCIVARIEELFARIEEARRLHAAASQDAEELMPAALNTTFRQARRQAAKIAPLGSVCAVEMGQSPPGDSYYSEPKGLPLLNGPTEFGTKYPTPVQWTTAPTKVCQPGDLLICVRGATTGRTNWADQSYCIGRGIAAIRSRDSEGTLLDYVAHYVHAQADQILAAGRGSTFPNLTKTQLISWDLPLLTLPEQYRIVEYLDGVQAQVVELKRLQAESAAELERLSAAVLARAFRGEL